MENNANVYFIFIEMNAAVNLSDVPKKIADCLRDGATNPKSDWRVPAFITKNGGARHLVLRGFDECEKVLLFYTDRRSQKIQELRQDDRASALFLDMASGMQIKIDGSTQILTDDSFMAEHWLNLPESSRRLYAAKGRPGECIESHAVDLCSDEEARRNFTLMSLTVEKAEVFILSTDGNRRAKIKWDERAPFVSPSGLHWLVP